jgi:large subunit ribosomal protein L47
MGYQDVRRSTFFDKHAIAEEATVEDKEVGTEEVESRDEGFGGGREAKEFVEETEVDDDGRVKKA